MRTGRVRQAGATASYQWLRDGRRVAKATHPTYTVRRGDMGHGLSVEVTWNRRNFRATTEALAVASPVTTVPEVRVRTEAGELRARHVVLATSAYTHHLLPRVTHRFIPLYDYILVSEPLTPAQREAVGWRRRQGVTDGRTFFNYYRLTADDRILWGTSEAAYYPGNRVDPSCDHSPAHYAALRASFRRVGWTKTLKNIHRMKRPWSVSLTPASIRARVSSINSW